MEFNGLISQLSDEQTKMNTPSFLGVKARCLKLGENYYGAIFKRYDETDFDAAATCKLSQLSVNKSYLNKTPGFGKS